MVCVATIMIIWMHKSGRGVQGGEAFFIIDWLAFNVNFSSFFQLYRGVNTFYIVPVYVFVGAKQRKSDILCEFGTRSLAPTTWLSLCALNVLPKILLFLELLSFWYFIG